MRRPEPPTPDREVRRRDRGAVSSLAAFVRSRTGGGALTDWVHTKMVPRGAGFLRALGTPLLVTFGIQAITGMFLALNYSASPDHAYDSIQYIQREVTFGALLRGIHYFGASAMVILLGLHVLRVFFTGAYKAPRELLWITGVFLLAITVLFGFTGYLLPWDQKAYWATVVGTNIAESVPGVGPIIADLMRGGATLGAKTLSRFFALHVLFLPALIVLGITIHLALVHHLGIAAPGARVGEDGVRDVPFFPDHVLKELVVAVGVVAVVFALALVFGAPLEERANPANNTYTPRPEWYFLGHYQLLKYLDGPLKVLGTVVLPGAFFTLLMLLPFLDRSRETEPMKRPVVTSLGACVVAAIGVLTLVGALSNKGDIAEEQEPAAVPASAAGAVAGQPPAGRETEAKPESETKIAEHGEAQTPPPNAVPASAETIARGKTLVESEGCFDCHTLNGKGEPKMDVGAPDLALVHEKHEAKWIADFLLKPKLFLKDATMDPFDWLSADDRLAIGWYLQTLSK